MQKYKVASLDYDTHKAAKLAAFQEGMTIKEFVSRALKAYLKKTSKPSKNQ